MARSLVHIALGAAPSPLDQMAATIVVALDDGRFDVAVEIFRKLSALDRIALGMKAIQLGADPKKVSDAAEAAAGDVPQDPPEIEMEPDFSPREFFESRTIASKIPLPFWPVATPKPTNTVMIVAGIALAGLIWWLWKRKAPASSSLSGCRTRRRRR